MKINTSYLAGVALDYAVALAAGTLRGGDGCFYVIIPEQSNVRQQRFPAYFKPSTLWAQGGPIIEREIIELNCYADPRCGVGGWTAYMPEATRTVEQDGPTPLIAAMRCFVRSKLGDVVDIPDKFATGA